MKKRKKSKSGHKARGHKILGHRGGKQYSGKNYVMKGKKKLYGAAAVAHLKKHPHKRAAKRSKAKHSR